MAILINFALKYILGAITGEVEKLRDFLKDNRRKNLDLERETHYEVGGKCAENSMNLLKAAVF
jgi:hypothetical protein